MGTRHPGRCLHQASGTGQGQGPGALSLWPHVGKKASTGVGGNPLKPAPNTCAVLPCFSELHTHSERGGRTGGSGGERAAPYGDDASEKCTPNPVQLHQRGSPQQMQ